MRFGAEAELAQGQRPGEKQMGSGGLGWKVASFADSTGWEGWLPNGGVTAGFSAAPERHPVNG